MNPKEEKEPSVSSFYQFSLLMWKVFLLRKRHYIVTFIEVVLAIVIISIPVIIQQSFSGGSRAHYEENEYDRISINRVKNSTIFPAISPYDSDYFERKIDFIFTPNTTLGYSLMMNALKLWKNKTAYGEIKNVTGVKNENDLEEKSLEIQSKWKDPYGKLVIGIVFNNLDTIVNLPNSLHYKIRFCDDYTFYTSSKYRPFRVGPSPSNSYIESGFLGIQAAIENTFINLKGRGESMIQVLMRRFPYPQYEDQSDTMSMIDIAGMLLCYGLFTFLITIVKRVVEEKANRSKELLKMMGMTDFVYWSGTFTSNFIVAFIICLVSAILYYTPFNGISMLKHTDFTLCLVLLLLITASSILFCFTISTLFNRPIFAVIAVIMIWVISNNLISMMLFYVNDKYFLLNISSKLAICLIPTGSLVVVYRMVSAMEIMGAGAQWSNMGKFIISQDINLAMVMAMMLLSCFIFSVLIWYIDAVCPWQYGVPKPLYFPFTKSYWFGHKKPEFDNETIAENPFVDYFEDEPTGISPGVVINHLSKVFRTGMTKKAAVDDISLKIYNGQITALLGHNGAGKTTTINVLTGLYRPTNGSATIDGWNILTHTRNARFSMGICAQHNILYDTLTVEEHLKLYAGMKGIKWKELNKETSHILDLLQLSEKKKELSKNLSGGMKRKLSLGIAIIGGSKVLFLDEPTSGLDPEARRSIWDMLLSIRENRTIVLTTHYMEEADILGERIAIMADGKIRCCGSPLFLKKKFGTGYQFHLVKSPECDLNEVTAVLQKHVPGTSLESATEKDVTYSLAGNMIASFGKMFEELENQKDSLGICSFGLSVTTMEDVFLRVTTMTEGSLIRLGENGTTTDNDTCLLLEDDALFKYTKQTGVTLLFQQIRGLLTKRFHHAKRHWGALLPKLIIPFLMMTLLSWILETQSSFTNIVEKPLEINLKSIYGSSKGFYSSDNVTKSVATKYIETVLTSASVTAPFVPDPIKYILRIGKKDFLGYITDYLVGGSSELSHNNYMIFTAWYNGESYHSSPVSLNMMNTALLRYVTNSSSASFQLTNSPLPSIKRVIQSSFSPQSVKGTVSSFMSIILAFLSSSYVIVAIDENVSRAKLLQLMSGVSALVYWSSMLVWDLLSHFLCCIILLIPFGIFNGHVFFGHSEAIGTLLLIFLLYGWCSIPLSYLVSFLFKKPATGFNLLVTFCVISGLIPSIIFTTLGFGSPYIEGELTKKIDIAMWFMRLFPSFSVTWGLGNLFEISFANAFCDDIPENILTYMCQDKNTGRKIMECCKDEQGNRFLNITYPITWKSDACGREITLMFIDGILFLIILFFCESPIPTTISSFIANFWKGENTIFVQPANVSSFADSDVLNEVQYVEMLDPSIRNENALLAVGLTKYYKNMCAVDNLTFSVHLEECFGLLGINGAGKTSTFKMLVGDIQPTKGNAFIKGSSLQHDLKKFQSYVGYCPQYDALIDRLTGREMLTLFARLRGIPEAKINDCVSQFITTVDLQDHSEKQTSLYSGGNKRKLSLALAVIGYPPIILLDEPTSGVDPASRRKIWNILSLVRSATGSSVILTTHSMEESEALCNRLAIMVSGQFRCLGSIQELKRKFAQGYTVIAKLNKEQIIIDPLMTNAKTLIEKSIPSASLKDGHQGILHYHVCDTSVPWSQLFYTMEELKEALQLEDYLISDTTLEQIFLAFARSQRLSSEGAV